MCIHTEKVQYRLGEDVAPQSKFFTLLVHGAGVGWARTMLQRLQSVQKILNCNKFIKCAMKHAVMSRPRPHPSWPLVPYLRGPRRR